MQGIVGVFGPCQQTISVQIVVANKVKAVIAGLLVAAEVETLFHNPVGDIGQAGETVTIDRKFEDLWIGPGSEISKKIHSVWSVGVGDFDQVGTVGEVNRSAVWQHVG